MRIQIKSENLSVDARLKKYAEDKIFALTKYLGSVSVLEATVKLATTSKRHQKGDIYVCEISLALPGEVLRVSKTTDDIFKAVDKVKDHLERSIERYKEKL